MITGLEDISQADLDAFAQDRMNKLKKPITTGVINNTIDTIIRLVNGFLGQSNDNQLSNNVMGVIVPFAIYVGLIVVTFGSNIWFSRKFNFNIYRILALLVLYIISYTELKKMQFFVFFLLGIGFEIWFIVLQYRSVES
jgi:cation transport ATPase